VKNIPHDPNEILDIVNDKDEVIGQATRKKVHDKGLRHRETFVFVVNSKKEILLQTRSDNGLIDASVSGHMASEKEYEETALKECEEEIGLIANSEDLVKVFYFSHESPRKGPSHKIIAKGFIIKKDVKLKDFKIDEDELAKIKYYSIEEINKIVNNPVKKATSTMIRIFRENLLQIS